MNWKDKARLREMREKGIDPYAPLEATNRERSIHAASIARNAAARIHEQNVHASMEPRGGRIANRP